MGPTLHDILFLTFMVFAADVREFDGIHDIIVVGLRAQCAKTATCHLARLGNFQPNKRRRTRETMKADLLQRRTCQHTDGARRLPPVAMIIT